MNVLNLYASRSVRQEPPSSAHEMPSQRPAVQTPLQKVTDELILSKRAQRELSDMRSRPETDATLKSSLEPVELSSSRNEEVASRIRSGYYNQPEVAYEVAAAVSGALSYGSYV